MKFYMNLLFIILWSFHSFHHPHHQLSLKALTVFQNHDVETENQVQKRQNLEIDSCVDKASNFCQSKVENSVCNIEKNECFCKRGYVVIKERHKAICKPLLTDLQCRIDRDCVHVSGSMCHPGAGQCVCPSRHVFVPQLFLCRKKYELATSETGFCKLCRENNGECFLYDPKDTRIFGYKTRETVGCSCGGNKALIAMESPTTLNICSATLVDIGQVCNDRDRLCFSLKATCVKVMNYVDKCQCIDGHVAIYQTTLRYYECFPIFDERIAPKQCAKCHSSGGKCYDTTNSNKPDGCACPASMSNIENGSASLNNPCTISHVIVDFQDDKIKLCFLPFTFPPFENLQHLLKASRAALYINHPQTQIFSSNDLITTRKKLKIHSQLIQDKNYFCGIIDPHEKDQPIKAKQIQDNKIQYEGTLELVRDTVKQDLIVDVSMGFKCEREGNIKDRKIIINDNNSIQQESLQLELRVLDATKNREIVKIGIDNPVVLDITLIDSTGLYTDLMIENCFLSNISSYDFPTAAMSASFVYQRCSNSTKHLNVIWKQLSPGIHYQTTPIFINQPHSWKGDVYIHCQISLCSRQQSCQLKECNEKFANDPQNRLLYRYTKISRLEKQEESLDKIYGIKENNCPYSLCLNQLQAVMTSILLLLLLLLVVILLLILFKRQRMLQKFSMAKLNIPSTVNSYKTSSDFMNGNNQNFYLLTDNNSVANSNDNFDLSDTTIPLRDNGLSNSFHLRTEPYERPGNQYTLPHFHRPVPLFSKPETNQVMMTSFQTIPHPNIKIPDINMSHNPTVSTSDHQTPTESNNLQKINNLDSQKPINKNTNVRCSEMICMCNE